MGTETFTYGSVNPDVHTFDQKVISVDYLCQKATAETNALYYYSCVCGEKGDETFEREKTPDDQHEYTSACDTFCDLCGQVRNTTVEHTPSENNPYVCDVCHETIGKENWTEPDEF
jgi:hypothetical protein